LEIFNFVENPFLLAGGFTLAIDEVNVGFEIKTIKAEGRSGYASTIVVMHLFIWLFEED
jgi:hypothetical protein